MNNNEKVFIALIKAYLNTTPPILTDNADFEEIYRLATINNIAGIIANEVCNIKEVINVNDDTLSKFKQQIGYTVIKSAETEASVNEIRKILCHTGTEHIFVKGEIIKNYYPIPSLRTSADTDIIVRNEALGALKEYLKDNGYKLFDEKAKGFSVWINKSNVEIHSQLDYDNEYFKDIFTMCKKDGLEYKIDDYSHLLYIICHIIKHFKYCGAGIKMFMDIDVIIRHINNFDYDLLMSMCKKCGVEIFSKAALSICNYLFDTPVKAEIDFNANDKLKNMFEDEIINSGTFGFEKRNLGSHYALSSAKDGIVTKSGAIRQFFFPNIQYLKKQYAYLDKSPYLLPIAWCSRIFKGVFIRGKHSATTINQITKFNDDTFALLLNELDI